MTQPAPATHPSQQQLAAFVRGTLNDAEDQEVEAHVGGCNECSHTLSALSDDTIVGLLRQPDPAALQETLPPAGDFTEAADAAARNQAELPAELANHPRYQVLELLGAGGMGSVYKAQHRLMNRAVALKVINQQLVRSEAAVKRFHREVQAAARLTHPNIVTAHDAEQAGDVHFLVMEYVEGIDLAEVVRRRGPLPVAEACDYIRQAALGLEHAHEHGMVHRDIKPQNLMITASGGREPAGGVTHQPANAGRSPGALLKILDFGLAGFVTDVTAELVEEHMPQTETRVPTHLTQIGSMMGTPDYISPEQARDAHTADIRADIYSLGCTLYYVLAGRPPFGGATVLEKVMAHLEREPQLLSELRQDLPPGLEDVLRRMLAKDPADRYQTPAELAKALEPFVVPPSGGSDRRKPGLQRVPLPKRTIAIAAALLVAFFAALAGVIFVATDRGILQIQSDVEDVKVVVSAGGQEVATIDAKTGSQIRWLPTGDYEISLVGKDNDIRLDKAGFQMTRLGRVIVNAQWNAAALGTIRSLTPADQPITQDGVTPEEGGWKITSAGDRSVRLIEVTPPPLGKGPFFYRAKLKTQDVKGKAYLEMWVRIPGLGEFFSKGLDKTVSGTNGWAEYEIPFYLKEGQQPDLVKLNVTIEGAGTVWIKDIQLRGRQAGISDHERLQGRWDPVSAVGGGEPVPTDQVFSLEFAGQEHHMTSKAGRTGGSFSINPARDPKELDLRLGDVPGGLSWIYRFVGDQLEVCLDARGEKRPSHWKTEPGTRQLLVRLRHADPATVPSLSDKALHALLCEAASISNADWTRITRSPTQVRLDSLESHSLSLVLFSLNTMELAKLQPAAPKDFSYVQSTMPKPSDMAKAMGISRNKGYASILQPEYITNCTFEAEGDTARGAVQFKVEFLYRGQVNYVARRKNDTWIVEEFHLPNCGISIHRGDDGNWKRVEGSP